MVISFNFLSEFLILATSVVYILVTIVFRINSLVSEQMAIFVKSTYCGKK